MCQDVATMDAISPGQRLPDKPMEAQPSNPTGWREEVDHNGQRWNVSPTGQRLKIGGTIGPGAPKKEVRQRALRGADASIKWALRIMESDRADDDPTRIKAAELLLRYGLGTEDKVEVAKPDELARTLANVLLESGMSLEDVAKIADRFAEAQGIA